MTVRISVTSKGTRSIFEIRASLRFELYNYEFELYISRLMKSKSFWTVVTWFLNFSSIFLAFVARLLFRPSGFSPSFECFPNHVHPTQMFVLLSLILLSSFSRPTCQIQSHIHNLTSTYLVDSSVDISLTLNRAEVRSDLPNLDSDR